MKKSRRPKKDMEWPFIRYSEREGSWIVDARTKNGGSRKFFKLKVDAETFAQQCRIERENSGIVGFGNAELAQFGKTVHDAIAFYLAHLRRLKASRPVKEVVTAFLTEKQQIEKRSVRYIDDADNKLDRFVKSFGEHMIAGLAAEEITEWLDGLGVAAVTRNTFRKRLSAVFSFAKGRKWLSENPFAGGKKADVRRIDEPRKKVRIFTNDQARRLLDGASEECLPFWAISIFAGLRPESEILRLLWEDIDFEQKVIIVDGEASEIEETKTGRRVVHMSENLVAWLCPYADRKGPVAPQGDVWDKLRKDKRPAGFGKPGSETAEERAKGLVLQRWTIDIARHTYGSNHLAQNGDIGKTATQMGNSIEIIRQRYLALVKPATAAAFWKINPNPASKIAARPPTRPTKRQAEQECDP